MLSPQKWEHHSLEAHQDSLSQRQDGAMAGDSLTSPAACAVLISWQQQQVPWGKAKLSEMQHRNSIGEGFTGLQVL